MSKNDFRLRSGKVYFLIASSLCILYFQNCAPPQSIEAASFEMASESEAFMVVHEDSDRTLPGEGKAKAETRYEPILADRYYVESLILDVFGPSALIGAVTTYLNTATVSGSPCSVNEDSAVLNSAGARTRRSAMAACSVNSGNYLSAQVLPKPTVTRQARLTRMCSDLVQTTATFNYALKRISSATHPPATEQNLMTLFSLFYRVHPAPHQGLVDSLRLMFSDATPVRDEWKAVIYTVCASSQWQVL